MRLTPAIVDVVDLGPNDNQGVRFCWQDVRYGRSWERCWQMGRFCILCAAIRPNEAFGAKGRRARICRKCRRLPREQQEALRDENEIRGFLEQSHISRKNVARLSVLTRSANERTAKLAVVMLEVARFAPHRRRRIRRLARERRDVLRRMEEVGLILPRPPWEDTDPWDDNPFAAWDEWVNFASDCAEVNERPD